MIIRGWKETDRPVLVRMILDCLTDNYTAGAEMLPTEKNAQIFATLGILAADKGEPCFVAEDEGRIIGYVQWLSLPNPAGIDMRGRPLVGFIRVREMQI